jgi:SAM-dependent methyltransferase
MSAVEGYAAEADALARRYLALPAIPYMAPLARALPPAPARMADIGAGPGRDAMRFARLGYRVTAVEPVAALRGTGAGRRAGSARWLPGALPELPDLGPADIVWVNAVWHHVPPGDRAASLGALRRVAGPAGRIVMSLRHGPLPPERPGFEPDRLGLLCRAAALGLRPILVRSRPSIGAWNRKHGVRWTWLVLARSRRERPVPERKKGGCVRNRPSFAVSRRKISRP